MKGEIMTDWLPDSDFAPLPEPTGTNKQGGRTWTLQANSIVEATRFKEHDRVILNGYLLRVKAAPAGVLLYTPWIEVAHAAEGFYTEEGLQTRCAYCGEAMPTPTRFHVKLAASPLHGPDCVSTSDIDAPSMSEAVRMAMRTAHERWPEQDGYRYHPAGIAIHRREDS